MSALRNVCLLYVIHTTYVSNTESHDLTAQVEQLNAFLMVIKPLKGLRFYMAALSHLLAHSEGAEASGAQQV